MSIPSSSPDLGISAFANIGMNKVKTLFGNLATTNYYQLQISEFPLSDNADKDRSIQKFFSDAKVNKDFYTRDLNLLCSDAVIPASAFATSEVKDNFMGLTEEFAHSRIYTDIELTFYADRNYKVNRFFEAWMDYSSNGSAISMSSFDLGYYRRMNYPRSYKHQQGVTIVKFEKDANTLLRYKLRNAFVKSITSTPVAYGQGEIMKVSVTFNYDYYSVSYEEYVKGNEDNLLGDGYPPDRKPEPTPNGSTGGSGPIAIEVIPS
jgi:hypothetical protein